MIRSCALLAAVLACAMLVPSAQADNSCRYAHDGECDEPGLGSGFCDAGSDSADCKALAEGGNDSCRWAHDGECDEPGIGGGDCDSGTDLTDCRPVAGMRYRNNSCQYAFDGECDEPDTGTGACLALTDTVDCLGRDTLAGLRDFYMGHDDRVRLDSTQVPWRSVGQVTFTAGGECTATLVAPRVALTAAHCLFEEGSNTIDPPIAFIAGRSFRQRVARANVVGWFLPPGYTNAAADDRQSGPDWGLLLLDQPIGDQAGFLPIHQITAGDRALAAAGQLTVSQAGYAWDADRILTGHLGCRVVRLLDDGTLVHECDTTVGDSGSPILIEVDGHYEILAVDSRYGSSKDGPINLAVDSRAFAEGVAKYLAGLR